MHLQTIRDRLLAAQREGAWGYTPGNSVAVEPTCWAALALQTQGGESARVEQALDWLARRQQDDGSLPVVPDAESPCWVTGLAVMAWCLAGDGRFAAAVSRAADWLIGTRGKLLPYNPAVFGHDTSLTGWSWVEGTHSWVEPTAYAVLALRSAGQGEHPRVREGVRLLLDRAMPGGGWNYGNTRVFHNTLRPFPGPSGVALTALADEPGDARIEAGIEYLRTQLPAVRSPMSLAWGLIGLTAHDTRPTDADSWLEESAERSLRRPPCALHDALLLFASLQTCPLRRRAVETVHG